MLCRLGDRVVADDSGFLGFPVPFILGDLISSKVEFLRRSAVSFTAAAATFPAYFVPVLPPVPLLFAVGALATVFRFSVEEFLLLAS